ncbi:MAG: 23S rRNA (uracil(1939)-C(5))-methyltransferase RlmD, partial [Oscillospiraceae bacterium]|nr:23S rRNA (uracil(1939)-C(5))-methyltransferase RlmD [Oscillospiraceae bacterium]
MTAYGQDWIEDELCGCTFRIPADAFYQTNPYAAENLYKIAIEMADLQPGERIGDAYCGTGTIGIVA